MPYGDRIAWRDNRGRFRSPSPLERNRFWRGTLAKGLANFEFKTGTGVGEAVVKFAERLQQYAQDNAPWEDQTGDARRGLTAAVDQDNDDVTLTLSHTVEYGIWLEIRWGGRYAIIIPTIEQLGPEIYEEMQGMCGEIIYYVD